MTTAHPRLGAAVPHAVRGPSGWDQHPGVRTGRRLRPGERAGDLLCRAVGSWTYLIVLTVAVLTGAAVVSLVNRSADAAIWLATGLAAVAVIEVPAVLLAARRNERLARELALYQLDQGRRAGAVAEDLRAEMQRLRDDVARLAAHADIAGYPARRP
jgi:uncharacterized membrane protein